MKKKSHYSREREISLSFQPPTSHQVPSTVSALIVNSYDAVWPTTVRCTITIDHTSTKWRPVGFDVHR